MNRSILAIVLATLMTGFALPTLAGERNYGPPQMHRDGGHRDRHQAPKLIHRHGPSCGHGYYRSANPPRGYHNHGWHRPRYIHPRSYGHTAVRETYSYTDPAAVILGGAAGGLIGHSLGDGDPYATLSGVIVGSAVGYELGTTEQTTYRIKRRRW